MVADPYGLVAVTSLPGGAVPVIFSFGWSYSGPHLWLAVTV